MLDENSGFIICHKTGKRCLSSREADMILADARHKKRHHQTKVIPKRKYICEYCRWYHLTSMSFERARADRKSAKKHRKYIKIL